MWYADRLVAEFPREGNLYAARAEIEHKRGKTAEAAANIAQAVNMGADPGLISRLTREAAVANREGIVQDWLCFGPLPLKEGQTGVQAVDEEQYPAEAKLKPRAGDVGPPGNTGLAWQEHHVSNGFVIDFNALFGGKVNEQSVAYAVCYLVVADDMPGLTMLVGSDDQAKVYLNEKQIIKCDLIRGVAPDEDAEKITLKKGTNVLVFKVVNGGGGWGGCIRFVERNGLPAKGIRVSLTPEE
jgi:hypothetical protein